MAELLPLFYWVHIDAPGQVSHEYTERERERERERHIQVHSTHAHTHMYMHILIASVCTITCALFRKWDHINVYCM